ncbi:MAG: hypothetical protein HC842_04210, partial [Cytophagales bacterium]|nr:hypothetical protein [Cytophagales bacterium]
MDRDKQQLYTKVIAVKNDGLYVPVTSLIHPNPGEGKALQIMISTNDFENPVTLEVFDLSGASLYQFIIPAQPWAKPSLSWALHSRCPLVCIPSTCSRPGTQK